MIWKYDVSKHIKDVELKYPPVIIRVNKFNEDTASEFATKIAMAHNTGQGVIPIVIDSYGGEVYSLMSMIASIKSSDLPIMTVIEGKAMSCGAILFSFGSEGMRYMDKNATLMIHDVSSGAFGKVEDMEVRVDEAKRLNKKVYRMMARNCGQQKDFFWKKVNAKNRTDWYITPKEALEVNLANHVKLPKMNISVSVDYFVE